MIHRNLCLTFLFAIALAFFSYAQTGSNPAGADKNARFVDSLMTESKKDDPEIKYNSLARLIQHYVVSGQVQKAIHMGDSVVRSTPDQESSLGYVRFLSNLGISYKVLGKIDSAAHYFYKSYELAEREGYKQSQALTMVSLSSILSNFNLYDSSISVLKRAIPILEELQDSLAVANAYNNLGNKYSTTGNYAAALKNQLEALKIFEALGATRNYVIGIISIGNTYKEMNDEVNSVLYYEMALKGDTVLTDEYIGNIYVNWAESLLKLKQPELAIEKLNLSLKHWANHNCQLMYPLAQKAQALLDIGAMDSVKYYAEKSLQYAQQCKERAVVSASQFILGRYYARNGMTAESQQYLEAAYQIADSIGRTDMKRDVSADLYQYYKGKKDWQKAVQYLEIYKTASDSLLNKEQIQNTAKLETEFAFEQDKKELENTIKLEHEKAENALRDKRNLIIAIVVFAGFMVVIGYLINRNRLNELKSRQILNAKNEELEALNRAKEKMISLLSHDIRNPLFGLEGSLDMLIEGGMDEEHFKNSAIRTRNKLRNVSEFLDNLLNWAKSQLTGIKPKVRSIDASQLIQETIHLLQATIASKQLVVENQVAEKTFVQADYEMIQTVVRNILSNAIKFTPQGKKISLSVEKQAQQFLFTVSDEGIGLPANVDIFDLGATYGEGTEGESGTGLGLSISKEFVEKHQGKIWAESTGEGTLVRFSLPA